MQEEKLQKETGVKVGVEGQSAPVEVGLKYGWSKNESKQRREMTEILNRCEEKKFVGPDNAFSSLK
jgi:hypothetical protein